MYQLTNNNSIVRLPDGAIIPKNSDNTDYLIFLAWVGKGNVPKPIPAEPTEGKIAVLDSDYQTQFNDLAIAIVKANLRGDTAGAEDMKKEFVGLQTEYATKREAIING